MEKLSKLSEGVESALSLTQSDFALAATDYFEKLESGEVDEIDLYIAFKKVEKYVKTILPYIIDHIDANSIGKDFKKHGVSIGVQNTRPSYNFEACKDEIYNQLKSDFKDRENLLKSITKPTDVTDEETGEIVTINPPIKKQGTALVMRYEKDEA